MRREVLTGLLIGSVVIGTSALVAAPLDPATTETSTTAASSAVRTEIVRIDQWQLLRSSGDQLYAQLCASCHGVEGAGNGPAARALPVYPPHLNRLKKARVPEEHWRYVILSPCEDGHHRGPLGTETMPCWKRLFRQALGENNAGPMLVARKLTTYLRDVQE